MPNADVAQPVVHRLGKAEVTGSSPVISSSKSLQNARIFFVLWRIAKQKQTAFALEPISASLCSLNSSNKSLQNAGIFLFHSDVCSKAHQRFALPSKTASYEKNCKIAVLFLLVFNLTKGSHSYQQTVCSSLRLFQFPQPCHQVQ